MFKWCAWCQRLIGEADPLDEYSVTHGICAACRKRPGGGFGEIPSETLVAEHVFSDIRRSFETGHYPPVERFLKIAEGSEIPPSELLLGILQPALYEVGRLWQSSELTVAQEHAFSEWCAEVLARFETSVDAHADVILAVPPGNQHTLGARFLAVYLRDHGRGCRVVGPDLSFDEIAEEISRAQPRVVGFSVALPGQIPEALRLAARVRPRLTQGAVAIIGGRAVRVDPRPIPEIRIVRTLDEFREFFSL